MTDEKIITIPIDQLEAHPANSNVMSAALLTKLTEHIKTTGRYPPVIVRKSPHRNPLPEGEGGYQILDGHHRVMVLRRLDESQVRCVVWNVEDTEALTLLATLNRLQGADNARKRAALIGELTGKMNLSAAASKLPESLARLEKMLALNKPPAPPRAPQSLAAMPTAVHFFLLPDQRKRLEQQLCALGGTREEALMRLVAKCHGG